MRFWDSSAIIPLCLKEKESETIKRWIKTDENIVVWWGTRVECLSAVSRRRREGILHPDVELKARAILSALSEEWSEIQPSELVRHRAERLLMIHPLRSADAFQLAAALIWTQDSPHRGLEIVSLDQTCGKQPIKKVLLSSLRMPKGISPRRQFMNFKSIHRY